MTEPSLQTAGDSEQIPHSIARADAAAELQAALAEASLLQDQWPELTV